MYISRLHLSIDHALGLSFRRNMYEGSPKARFVARITLVKGVPFYGFYVGYKYYLKIYMLNPNSMKRLADLLRQGAIMKRGFQPYEAHLPFILQWMTDYNLFGCGNVDVDQAFFRGPVPSFKDMAAGACHLWHDKSIPGQFLLGEAELPRASNCALEVDIMVQDIQNRRLVKPRPLHHDFIERLHPTPPDEKLVHSMRELWRDETKRRKAKMGGASQMPESSPFPPEVLVPMSADNDRVSYSQRRGWVHEQEYRETIEQTVCEERDRSDGSKLSFDTYVSKRKFESSVRTAFDSVTDLYPENLRPMIFGPEDEDEKNMEVDENMILGVDGESEEQEFPPEWDEDIMKEVEDNQQRRQEEEKESQTQKPKIIETMDHTKAFVEPANGSARYDFEGETPKAASLKDAQASTSGRGTSSKLGPMSSGSGDGRVEMSDRRQPQIYDRLSSLKRSASDMSSMTDSNKRQRVGIDGEDRVSTIEPSLKREASGDGLSVCERLGIRSRKVAPSSSQPLPSSHPTERPSRVVKTEALPFGVVKDPRNEATVVRLSQEGSSQKQRNARELSRVTKMQTQITPPTSAETSTTRSIASAVQTASQKRRSDNPRLIRRDMHSMRRAFNIPENRTLLTFNRLPPKAEAVLKTLQPSQIYQPPFYSNEEDLPERKKEWAGEEYKIEGTGLPYLPDFDPTAQSADSYGERAPIVWNKQKDELALQCRRRECNLRTWEIGATPPTYKAVEEWASQPVRKIAGNYRLSKSSSKSESSAIVNTKKHFSQIEGPTQKNKYGVKYTQQAQPANVTHQDQYMSVMSLEIHVNTEGDLVPNPEKDDIQAVFWCLQTDDDTAEENGGNKETGIIVLSEDGEMAENIRRQAKAKVSMADTELDLLNQIINIVLEHDPDVLAGYEVHGHSWGYLVERARSKYEYNLCDEFSRMRSQSHGRFSPKDDKWGFNHASSIRITGRHMLNIWRSMRSELTLTQYTFQNVAFHLLQKRVPHYSWRDLTEWYKARKPQHLQKVINYFLAMVTLDLDILEANELVSRTSEHARLLGIDFYSVFARGSQLKVESIMFRIAKPESFILVSPSRKQVGGQNALECLPLVMEPRSNFYTSPLLVMDFQSLYPSTMIAYNYCYSTFLGRIVNWRGSSKMGFTEYRRQRRLLELLKDHINITPNGMMFVKQTVRKSLLAKMLGEILETRVMVKSGMKVDPNNKALRKVLNNRQLALKLTANVTYGYTSASFSGRMPCAEIADSIVQTGRETLEAAISLIHDVPRWGAEVVYGDTDSLFIHLPGKTREEAFKIGEEIAKKITDLNPRPMKLNFEKVYHPCVLLAKKRYVGFKFEKASQVEPGFDAKGIETVRRDGVPAQAKITEKTIKLLFRTKDLSQVKSYFQQQCQKIMSGSVSIQDFIFAKEVKLGTYSDKGPPPPGALVATKRMLEDERAEPQYGERVPYVVVAGGPNDRLIDRTVSPQELLHNDHKELDADYYIEKALIPPLNRVLQLVGVDVKTWYAQTPKTQRIRRIDQTGYDSEDPKGKGKGPMKRTLESYMQSSSCLVCGEKMESHEQSALSNSICSTCLSNKPVSLLSIRSRLHVMEKNVSDIERICKSCASLSFAEEVKCDSGDCPVFYSRVRETNRLKRERGVVAPLIKVLDGDEKRGSLRW